MILFLARRFFLVIFILAHINFSAAANEQDATNFVNDLASRVIDLIKNPTLSDKEKESQLNNIFLKSVDTKWIGKFAMGRYWRILNTTQQSQFLDLYSNYLTGLYVPNFRKYTGNTIKILNSKKIRDNEYWVQTNLTDQHNNLNIRIDYYLAQKPGMENFVIFDVVAEGVSLITSQRAEITSEMDQGDFNSLLALMIKKTNGNGK